MKKMKNLLGSVLLLVAVFTAFASCNDDEDVITDFKSGIVGMWEKVNPQGVQDVGYVTWTFHPNKMMEPSGFGGDVTFFTSDWAAGDITTHGSYVVEDNGLLQVHTTHQLEDGEHHAVSSYNIVKMTTDRLVLNTVPQDNTAPTKIEFKRK